MQLDKMFNPKKIAVIGASEREGSVGYALMDNLVNSEYQGEICPVNNKRDSILNHRTFKSVKDISGPIDLAIIATPAVTVPSIVQECGEAHVAGIVIISSGFSEIGEEGKMLSEQILATAKKYQMRIVGPNCLGFIRPSLGLNASFAPLMALKGKIAFISQSGALCTAILDWSLVNNVGFSHFISIGSMVDVDFSDLIDYLATDTETESIIIYMESIGNAEKFMQAAKALSKKKPIVILKVGRTSAGAQAAKSHTGSIVGDDEIFSAAFEKVGIIRVETIENLFHVARALAMQPIPQGNRMCVVTNAGGPGVIVADALVSTGGRIAELKKETMDELNGFLPVNWSHSNPVDILGDADPERYVKTLDACLKDDNADAVLVILTPQAMTNPTATARALVAERNTKKKTIYASWMGGAGVAEGGKILEQGNIPIYSEPEDAIKSFSYINKIHANSNGSDCARSVPVFSPNTKANQKIIAHALKAGRDALNEMEAKAFLKNYKIPVVKNAVVQTAKQAGEIAKKIGFPVAMKILSSEIIHKTDVGGVMLNISSSREAQEAFIKIISSVKKKKPKAIVDGVLIEGMIKKDFELLIGVKKDPIFGPVIAFGRGGTAVEVYQDTAIALPPIDMCDAKKMIEKTKISTLLKGYRGMRGVDMNDLQFVLYKFSRLIADFPEIKELDINPFAIDAKGGVVLDAKILL
jgi:acetyltransferase